MPRFFRRFDSSNLSIALSRARSLVITLDPTASSVEVEAQAEYAEELSSLHYTSSCDTCSIDQQPVSFSRRFFSRLFRGQSALDQEGFSRSLVVRINAPSNRSLDLHLHGFVDAKVVGTTACLTADLAGGSRTQLTCAHQATIVLSDGATCQLLDARDAKRVALSGISALDIKALTGTSVVVEASGTATLNVADGQTDHLSIQARMASKIMVWGTANTADVQANGMSSVILGNVGSLRQQMSGMASCSHTL